MYIDEATHGEKEKVGTKGTAKKERLLQDELDKWR